MPNIQQLIAEVIPTYTDFILVDHQQLADATWNGRRAIPFLEKRGKYWGPPGEDHVAIREMERLRRLGAQYIVFISSTFWWLDYFPAFRAYLQALFQCVFRNENLMVFDLRRRTGVLEEQRSASRAGTNECPVCGGRYGFEPYGDPPRQAARCPACRALERHRLLWLYLNKEILPKRKQSYRILHCAPEDCLQERLRQLPDVEYVSIDLSAEEVSIHMDLTDLWFRDQVFDLVICSHVLEHIPDDRKAMSELFRVCKVGGIGLLNVPYDPDRNETYEDWTIGTPEGRHKAFGQHDHVRIYSPRDYVYRLTQAGWVVSETTSLSFGEEQVKRFVLPLDSHKTIFRCERPRA